MAYGAIASLPRRHQSELRALERGRASRPEPTARRSDRSPRRRRARRLDDRCRARVEGELEQFRDGTLLPKLTAGIEGGFSTPPEETAIDVYNFLP